MLNIGMNCVVLDLVDYKAEQKKLAKLEARVAELEKMVSIKKSRYDDDITLEVDLGPLYKQIYTALSVSEYKDQYVLWDSGNLHTSISWGIFEKIEKEVKEEAKDE